MYRDRRLPVNRPAVGARFRGARASLARARLVGALVLTGVWLTPVLAHADRAQAVAVGYDHTCAITRAGGLKCWGRNGGQLGDGTATDRTTATDVLGLTTGVATVVAGAGHTCAVTTGGGAKCWGGNFYGEVGDGTTTWRPVPTDVSGLTSGVAAVSAGEYHTCAVTTAGGLKCWGRNDNGQLGDGTTTSRTTPTDVPGLTSGVGAVSAGDTHTCALTTGGGAKCWGVNDDGQLGDGTWFHRWAPTDVSGLTSGVVAVSAGLSHTCALTASGGVKCWGVGGWVGDGTSTRRLTPTDVWGMTRGSVGVDVSMSHSCAITTGGGVRCWGNNYYGQLGNGTTMQRWSPVDVTGLTAGVASVVAGFDDTCAVTSGGGAKCWGINETGQLGDGTTEFRVSPTDVSGLMSGTTAVAPALWHTYALTSAGGVKCWGDNFYGQLGDGTTTMRTTPTDVLGLTSGVAAVAAVGLHTCALMAGSGVKCWGDNSAGQLGDGTTIGRLTPTDVSGLTSGAAAIDAGDGHTCALMAGGGVKCWGGNSSGQLGDGTTTGRLTPYMDSSRRSSE